MKGWNKSLGVNCQFCHTNKFTDTYETLVGNTASKKDFKALVHENTASSMLGMLGIMLYLNQKENKNYTCESCHQRKAHNEKHPN